eukprot:sb/3477180/
MYCGPQQYPTGAVLHCQGWSCQIARPCFYAPVFMLPLAGYAGSRSEGYESNKDGVVPDREDSNLSFFSARPAQRPQNLKHSETYKLFLQKFLSVDNKQVITCSLECIRYI